MKRHAWRVVNAAIEGFNDWLGSENGLLQGVALTIAWTVAAFTGVDQHGFAFLYFATALSFITQFNIAIIGRRSSTKIDEALRTIDQVVDEVFVSTQALIRLAENESTVQTALIEQTDAMVGMLAELRAHIAPEKPKPQR